MWWGGKGYSRHIEVFWRGTGGEKMGPIIPFRARAVAQRGGGMFRGWGKP